VRAYTDGLRPGRNCYPAAARDAGNRLELEVQALMLLPRRGPLDGIFVNPFEQGEIGPGLFRAACDMGLEGLVSKRSDRPYGGGRSPHWIKVKNRQHHAFDRVRESFPCRSGSASTPRKRSPTRIT
jgi:hypothetical protein